MGTAPRGGELGRKKSQVHSTPLAPYPRSARLSLQGKPGTLTSPHASQLTPKSPLLSWVIQEPGSEVSKPFCAYTQALLISHTECHPVHQP